MLNRGRLVWLVLVMFFASVAGTLAQNQGVSAGYQFYSASQRSSSSRTTYPVGFYVDAAKGLAPMVALVGELGGGFHALHHINVIASQYTYQAGVRFMGNTLGTSPYVQLLVGGATNRESGGPILGSSKSALSVQFGGGVNINTDGPPKVRVGVDYRRVSFSQANGGGENDVRVVIGLAFPIGQQTRRPEN